MEYTALVMCWTIRMWYAYVKRVTLESSAITHVKGSAEVPTRSVAVLVWTVQIIIIVMDQVGVATQMGIHRKECVCTSKIRKALLVPLALVRLIVAKVVYVSTKLVNQA